MDNSTVDLYAVQSKIMDVLNNSRRTYEVSKFQRPYAWGQLQQDDLLEDLVKAMKYNKETGQYESGDFFMGSFIFYDPNQSGEMKIVDGQQRLITLTIILSIIHKKFIFYSKNNRVSVEVKTKAESLIDEVKSLIYMKDDGVDYPIISPFKEVEKEYFFGQILNSEKMEIDKPEYMGCNNYYEAYTNIMEYLDMFIKSSFTSKRIVEFYRGVYRQIIHSYGVRLEFKDEERAYKIYSNLNNSYF